MARLKQLASRLKPLGSRFASAPVTRQDRDRDRDTQSWRRWYKTARWQKLRMSILQRDLFTCQRCQRIEGDTSQLVADHRRRHGGDEAMFWDAGNLQCLCKHCHDSAKQREERRSGY
ncbi:HNH endonuclease [Sphingomonas sp. Leaf4]|uniref:HNH endonuclease n=1 Tax=Sphingomonas sp. Leaf4 TaxID=2876553 RepID=UPI001E296221|nr:HNH endonuclease signature motif containing protein [Sphingomonas sp. Leaf4]